MRKFKRFHLFMALTLVSSLLLTACGTSSTTTATIGKTLNIAITYDVAKLDPSFSTALVERQIYPNIYDKLIDLDKDGKFIPMLAEKWSVSPDGKTYTMNLRQGVK
ncbi:MAG: ABC transporter substrate-binding protein, partial [Desulfitobacteriaceae bacterium]